MGVHRFVGRSAGRQYVGKGFPRVEGKGVGIDKRRGVDQLKLGVDQNGIRYWVTLYACCLDFMSI